jgi:hypothetical protein
MHSNRAMWPKWARFLHRWGLEDFAACMLEATGPLAVLAAQFVYLGQPFINQGTAASHVQALAELLENPAEIKSFAAFLREENTL